MSVGKNPSPTPPHKGEGLWRRVLPLTMKRAASAPVLPPCGGDGRQARGGLRAAFLMLVLLFTPIHAFAVNPDEVLADPALEQRARALSAELRCMVCQNQSIAESNAPLAVDLRNQVREQLAAGKTLVKISLFLFVRRNEYFATVTYSGLLLTVQQASDGLTERNYSSNPRAIVYNKSTQNILGHYTTVSSVCSLSEFAVETLINTLITNQIY